MRKRKIIGGIFITLGVLLLAAAIGVSVVNFLSEYSAKQASDAVMTMLDGKKNIQNPPDASTPAFRQSIPDYVINPDMDMPVKLIDGNRYIGVLEIPSLGLSLPVMEEWSYAGLRRSPCRYFGSPYKNNFVIAAHNYYYHFGSLRSLLPDAVLSFTDIDGNTFDYHVCGTEVLEPSDVEKMTDGTWDLTLFTCTFGGAQRITVRCELLEKQPDFLGITAE